MSVIRVGSSGTYAEGWDSIFGGRTPAAKKSGKGKASKATTSKAKTAPATKAGKKKASRVVKKKVVTKASKPGKSRRG